MRDAAGVLETDGVARTEARLEAILPEGPERDRLRSRLRPLLGLEADEASREENFEAWRRFLESLASDRPVVLAVEDLHWADEAMLAFMDYLARSDSPVPLLVLASARPEVTEVVGPGAGFVAAAAHIPLGPLSGEETAELARARLGAKSLPTDLQALILERSGGNPFFAEELVRLLQDRALLETHGGKVALKPGAEVPLPDSIGALIAARLELLSPERKALLADAAVVGRSFWAGAVAAVGPHEVAEVFEGFYDLVAKELVRPERDSSIEGETEFAFVHALVSEVAYSQLTLADRAAKHAALARWLEEHAAVRTEDLAEVLAYHYGTALESAGAAGLFELVDELEEPTTRYLELAGGRAAPLDAAAAATHFARAERVAQEAAKPKRRFFLSRRARRTLRRRAPLLVAAAAVIVVALAVSLAVYQFRPQEDSPGPARLTPGQIADKYGTGLVRITARVPVAVNGRLRWEKRVGVGFVASKDGLIITSNAVVDDTSRRGPMVRTFYNGYPLWVTCELWGAQGQHTRVRGLVVWEDPSIYGCAFIAVDPSKVRLKPIPIGDATVAHVGMPVVALRFLGSMPHGIPAGNAMVLTAVWHDAGPTGKTVAAMRTDVQLGPSDIGAPLFDTAKGEVIGWVGPVPPLFYNDATGDHSSSVAGSAMSVAYLQGALVFVGQVNQGNKNWLALRGSDTQVPSIARALGLPTSQGVLVQWVDPKGPAARAGIRGGTRVKMVASEHTGWVAVRHRRRPHRRGGRKGRAELRRVHEDPRRLRAGRRGPGEALQGSPAADRQDEGRGVPLHTAEHLIADAGARQPCSPVESRGERDCAAATSRSASCRFARTSGRRRVRVDDVVGLALLAHGLGVVLQLHLLDGQVRLAQRAVGLGALGVDVADRGQALQGRLDRDAARQRVVAGQVLDGKERALLDVDHAVELVPEPRDLRAKARAGAGEPLQELGVRRHVAHDVGQRLGHVQLAGRLAVVEAHGSARSGRRCPCSPGSPRRPASSRRASCARSRCWP